MLHIRELISAYPSSIETSPLAVPSSTAKAVLTGSAARIAIETIVSRVFTVAPAELTGSTRGRAPIANARMVGMYMAHTSLGLTMSEVGLLFSRDRTTVAHACQVVEDRRDDPGFDRTLDLLDWALIATLCPSHARAS